jgi:hypothetical protein
MVAPFVVELERLDPQRVDGLGRSTQAILDRLGSLVVAVPEEDDRGFDIVQLDRYRIQRLFGPFDLIEGLAEAALAQALELVQENVEAPADILWLDVGIAGTELDEGIEQAEQRGFRLGRRPDDVFLMLFDQARLLLQHLVDAEEHVDREDQQRNGQKPVTTKTGEQIHFTISSLRCQTHF